MTTSERLNTSLQQALAGDAWYGPNTYSLLDDVTLEMAYEKPEGSVHNISGIVLHMLGWTQEVTARLKGKPAGQPEGGDWPEPGEPDEQEWKQLVADLKLANTVLSGEILKYPDEQWSAPITDLRDPALGTGVSHEQLIDGLIQHHVYHSGQIALLKRILS